MRGAKRRSAKRTHVRVGLGIDRLAMEVLGLANVREAVLFPRDRTRLAP